MPRFRSSKLWHNLRRKDRKKRILSGPFIGAGKFPVEVLQFIFSYLDTCTLFHCRFICHLWSLTIPSIGFGRLPIEILQSIFSHLDTWTLFRYRDVCRLWSQCLPGDSPALRKAMLLPSPHHNKPIKTTRNPTNFIFSVILYGDFERDRRVYQSATDYTVRSHLCRLVPRVPELDVRFSSLLLWDMTQTRLGLWKYAWENEGCRSPLWMTTLVCQPPTTTLFLHIEFMETVTWDRGGSYKDSVTLENETGVVLGDMLYKIYEAIRWPKMRLRCDRLFYSPGFEVLLEASDGDRPDESTCREV